MPQVHEAIRDEIEAVGHAEVVAVLGRRPGAALSSPPGDLLGCFLGAVPPGAGGGPCHRHFPRLGVIIGYTDQAGAAALAADPRVEILAPAPVPRLIRPVRRAPARTAAPPVSWGIEAVGAPRLWRRGFRGQGVRIAQLDTGVDGRHPALRRRIAAWAEFDPNGELVGGSRPHDPDGHGTHTAGTLVGGTSGGTAVGMAPAAELCAALVIEGGRVLLRVLAGLEWALGQGARVLSMSLGIPGYTPFALEIVRRLRAEGMLPVVAVGNEGPGTSRSPGNYAESLSVGAAGRDGLVADFSGSMRFARDVEPAVPDVVAPGVGILSLGPRGGREVMDGTSMATPHVAGLAALLFSARPESTVAEVESAILGGARPVPGGGDPVRYGRGAADAAAALAALTGEALGLSPRAPRNGTGTRPGPGGS